MKLLALLLLLPSLPLVAQTSSLLVGILGSTGLPHGPIGKDIDALYLGHHVGVTVQFQDKDNWTLAGRAYIVRHVFLQEAIKYNLITNPELKHQIAHPYVFQAGLGVDLEPFRHERFIFAASPSDRFKTVQSGYTLTFNSYYDMGHSLTFRTRFVRSRLLNEANQIGIGFDYSFHFKR